MGEETLYESVTRTYLKHIKPEQSLELSHQYWREVDTVVIFGCIRAERNLRRGKKDVCALEVITYIPCCVQLSPLPFGAAGEGGAPKDRGRFCQYRRQTKEAHADHHPPINRI